MRPKRKKQLSFERVLPSFSIEEPVEGQMEVSGLFSIEPSIVAVQVSTTLNGTTDIDFCAGSTFQEMFSELAYTNYAMEDILEFLKQQPEWHQIEERIKNEELAAIELRKKQESEGKLRDELNLASLSQILASDPANTYQFGWRKIFSSERAIRVFVRINSEEFPVSELFGSKPYDVVFDSVKNEFWGKINLPSPLSTGNPSLWGETFPYKFTLGVNPLELKALQIL